MPDEKDPRAVAAIDAWSSLKGERAHHEQDWEELARLIRPQRGNFTAAAPELPRNEKPLSSAPIVAQSNFASGLYGTLTNPANRWFELGTTDQALADFQPMREWLDVASRITLASFAPSVSPFYSQASQLFGDISTFGNAAQYGEQPAGERRFLDVTLSLAEVVVSIDAYGRVDEWVRRFKLGATAAARRYGLEALPERIQTAAMKGSRDSFVFFQHVHMNDGWRKGMLGPRGKRWSSIHVSEEAAAVVRHSGYADMPVDFPRWDVETGQGYGRGPGWIALAEARKLDLFERANLRAAQRAADPTLLAPEREVMPLRGRVRPGELVYGGVDAAGRKMLQTLDTVSGVPLTLEMKERAVEHIRDAFHWSLMNLAGRTGMTATEVIERQEEKLRLMAPHMGRVQEEYLAPKIARRFRQLMSAGQIPQPPQEARGADLTIEYTSAAAMAARSAEGAATVRLLTDLAPLAQTNPRVWDRLSEDDIVEVLAEARGAPARLLRSREEADKLGQARAQQEQGAQLLAAAEAGGGIMKDLAAAGAPEAAG
ncbi:portal protein [Albimonas pacifica]|uniref:Bacteriophage head to tail connecting protein n=1 Tax=Albimonas pacifica TaxID=1114924 RepID=A0A1I3JK25_9RHOB|nr:portal protein [Albimonas pacifica]SFI60601.1 Bacteriophage head to tail connecting protein [Albimonas pacifica]